VKQLIRIYIILMIFLPTSVPNIHAESQGDNTVEFAECDEKCSPFTGVDRYRCIKKCKSAKRKADPGSRNDTKKKMDECENACSGKEGVDKIKCIRLCLDSSKEAKVKLREKMEDEDDPCKSRCAVLSGSMKEKCMMKCRKEKKFSHDDPSGSRKK